VLYPKNFWDCSHAFNNVGKMARLTGLEPVILSPVVAFYVVLLPLLPWFRQLWRQKAMVAVT
jgi:hypothetical protein